LDIDKGELLSNVRYAEFSHNAAIKALDLYSRRRLEFSITYPGYKDDRGGIVYSPPKGEEQRVEVWLIELQTLALGLERNVAVDRKRAEETLRACVDLTNELTGNAISLQFKDWNAP
jgi:hypothetical protein